ncbi:hypothetical protein K3495_g12009 [Podosphaera aphanis]|nr:hypothetical protein K3495_g12009 [Podosphaera aphanis]
MGLGVLDCRSMNHVPGTIQNFEQFKDRATSDIDETGSGLKYFRSATESILLIPQPSDDPNDPLVSNNLFIHVL